MRPFWCAPKLMPPPKWTTIKLLCSYVFPKSSAIFRATAFWFKAWPTLRRWMPFNPEILANGCSSSTTTGSTIKAGTWYFSANSLAKIAPKFEAWVLKRSVRKSSSICWSTRYVPPGIGLSKPPRPTTAANCVMLCVSKNSAIICFRNGVWLTTFSKGANSWTLCLSVSSAKQSWLAKSANLVEVEPGLITNTVSIVFCSFF